MPAKLSTIYEMYYNFPQNFGESVSCSYQPISNDTKSVKAFSATAFLIKEYLI